ncbi:MAG: hypothetical protein HXY28_01935, partial [Hydrogenophilaceae bacterium]|nr:hypothetical protein [Hydrogenophilaceae bacterium]
MALAAIAASTALPPMARMARPASLASGFAVLAVFWAAAFPGTSHWLKAQIDLLPALMVYAGLSTGPYMITLLAVCGGLLFDSLSANPFGVSTFPLLAVGLAIHARRELILRDQP